MNIGCKLVSRGFNRGLTRAPRVSLLCNGTLYRYMSTQKFVDPTPSKEKEQLLKNIEEVRNKTKKVTWSIAKTFKFESAHCLVHHDGKCSREHGHSYICTVELRGNSLYESGPKKGMVIDFGDISKVVKPLIESHLDHLHLNGTLETDSPTAEYISMWIYYKLKPNLSTLHSVTIHETDTSKVTFSEFFSVRKR